MPSTISSSESRLLASSTVITPSLPTFFMALAIMSPIAFSPLAEMVPTCAISSEPEICFACFLIISTTSVTALSMPRLRSIGFMPAATALRPSRTMAWASRVAVVVPSPAVSLVLEATSRSICAPMFSNLSSSSISLATVTPSLVERGAPNDFSRITLRPFGPSVTLTALARMSTPRSMRSRASAANFTSLAAMFSLLLVVLVCSSLRAPFARLPQDEPFLGLPSSFGTAQDEEEKCLGEDSHDVGLLHDEELFAVDLDLGARPFAEQHLVAFLDAHRLQLAVLAAKARARRDDLAGLRLLCRRIGNDDAAFGLQLFLEPLDHDAVM